MNNNMKAFHNQYQLIFRYRMNKVLKLIRNWVKKNRNIERVKKPIDFRHVKSSLIPELNRFMAHFILFIAKDGDKPFVADSHYIDKSSFCIITKKIEDFLEHHKIIIHSHYSEDAVIEIQKIVNMLSF